MDGIGQLGTLVAVGMVVSALVMLIVFPPLAVKLGQAIPPHPHHVRTGWKFPTGVAGIVLLAAAAGFLLRGWPELDRDLQALGPRKSVAVDAFYAISDEMFAHEDSSFWYLTVSDSEDAMAGRLAEAKAKLVAAEKDGLLREYALPDALWPQRPHQQANLRGIGNLLEARERLESEARKAGGVGFSEDALALTNAVFNAWERMLAASAGGANPVWPEGGMSREILRRSFSRKDGQAAAIGIVHPTDPDLEKTAGWTHELTSENHHVAAWRLLSGALGPLVKHDLVWVALPMTALLVGMLTLAFRRLRDVVLALLLMVTCGISLIGLMSLFGWDWDMMNISAIPLLLGMGIDYSIHIILALRRERGDIAAVRRGIGRAILLCGSSTSIGFASLVFASSGGLVSLGKICAIGVLLMMGGAVFLLPLIWRRLARKELRAALIADSDDPGR